MLNKITAVVLPNKPQLDPITAYYLLLKYGSDKFPGIENANIAIWSKAEDPDENTLKEWEQKGMLGIDVGGGEFDHHGQTACATNLAAKYLGIDKVPELLNLLQYTQEDDEAGIHNKYGDLAYIIKCMYKQGKEDQEVINFVFEVLESLQNKEYEWHVLTKQEYEKKAKVIKVKRFNSKLKIVIIESDLVDIANYARQRECAAVVIQRRSSGHSFIFTNKTFKINLKPIIQAIRMRELELAGHDYTKISGLQRDGKHQKVQQWYYHPSLNALLNGSESLLDTPPTKIPLNELIEFVVCGVSSDTPHGCKDPAHRQDTCNFCKFGFNNK